MPDKPKTVKEYHDTLPPDRKTADNALRRTIKANMDKGIKEGIQYGMVGYFLPHSLYPEGYHCDSKQPLPFASVASQKSHIGLYLFCIYTQPEESARFQEEWKAAGTRLDMGKGCVRMKSLEDVPLEVVGIIDGALVGAKLGTSVGCCDGCIVSKQAMLMTTSATLLPSCTCVQAAPLASIFSKSSTSSMATSLKSKPSSAMPPNHGGARSPPSRKTTGTPAGRVQTKRITGF